MYQQASQIESIVEHASHIVVVQADNPDGDSLGTALALEHILGELGKTVTLYCGVDVPGYLRYLSGWDRVQKELPTKFDASIIVDASTVTLLEKLAQSGEQAWLASRPCIVLDHHEKVEQIIPYANVILNDWQRSSTGELLFSLAEELGWPLPVAALEGIMTAILGDTQGLSNQLTSADTYVVMSKMTTAGVNRPKLEEARRELSKMPVEIYGYKGELLRRTEFSLAGALASVTIPQSEINTFSPLYNPGPLVQGDMLQVSGVRVAIVFKHYQDGKITGSIRCNPGSGIAADLAEHLGGGGHAFASGFKITSGKPFEDLKAECIRYTEQLLSQLDSAA